MRYVIVVVVIVAVWGFNVYTPVDFERKDKLSEYNFFSGTLKELRPLPGVVEYSVRNPLFSNYAEKKRFIRLPQGTAAVYNDSTTFDLPQGTVLIKNFYYPLDMRDVKKGNLLIETRLLVHTSNGWEAYPYIWNKEQTDAFYDPAGETISVSYTNTKGKKITTPYVIPNKNQCKGCHTRNSTMMPIGLSARQLSTEPPATTNAAESLPNQLSTWVSSGLLTNAPPHFNISAAWDDISSGTVDQRARAYLDSNCAHCHSRSGPASTSGLYLDVFETDPSHLGVQKAPVAAGRGAGNMKYDIVPGQPQHSIMVFRMKTNDPAIAMPEIGREQIHLEGVALIEEWIRKHDFAVK